MPFTFSHPAAVLPAKFLPEKWVSMTALVIGSTTPDFEYFIRMRNHSVYSHTWSGMFWYDLPLAFILTFIYHNLVRDGLIDNLPAFIRNKVYKFKELDWNNYVKRHFFVVVTSLLVGIASHIAWDGFTHRNGYFVEMIPWLRQLVMVMGVGHYRYYILQGISSVVGGLIVAYSILSIKAEAETPKRNIVPYWVVASAVALLITAARIPFGNIDLKPAVPIDLIVTAMSAGMIGMVIAPFVLKIKLIRPAQP
jgi:hypothetical protein